MSAARGSFDRLVMSVLEALAVPIAIAVAIRRELAAGAMLLCPLLTNHPSFVVDGLDELDGHLAIQIKHAELLEFADALARKLGPGIAIISF